MATSPRSISSRGRVSSRFRAPRALKEPVFCRASFLTTTVAPSLESSVAEVSTGVACTRPAIRSAAVRTASASTSPPFPAAPTLAPPSMVVTILDALQWHSGEVKGRVGAPLDQDAEVLGEPLWDRRQDVVGRVLAAGRAADAQANAQEAGSAEGLEDVLEAVVPGRAAAAAHLELAGGQVGRASCRERV